MVCIPLVLLCIRCIYTVYMYCIHLVLLPYTTSTTVYIHHPYYCSTTPVYSTHPVYCTSTPVYTPYIAPVYRIYPIYMAPTGLGGGFRYRRGPWVVANHPGTAPVGCHHGYRGGRDTGKPPPSTHTVPPVYGVQRWYTMGAQPPLV